MILAAAVLLAQEPPAVEMLRKFVPGERLSYAVRSHLLTEQRQLGLDVFLPDEFTVAYEFDLAVHKAGVDGFAQVEYRRPKLRLTTGQTEEDLPKTETVQVDWIISMMLSPVNEVTDIKDLSPARPKRGSGLYATVGAARGQQNAVGRMIQELHSLALFTGNLDSSLDLSPKLPLEEVRPGATWKRTVGYQPAQVKGTDREAMQRLDYTFTYSGIAQTARGPVHRIVGTLALDTDASKFINQSMGMTASESGLRKLSLKLEARLEYDLDPKTFDTLDVRGDSTGGFSIEVVGESRPVVEERFKGTSTMRLVQRS